LAARRKEKEKMTQPDDNSNNQTPLPPDTHVAPQAPRLEELLGPINSAEAPELPGQIEPSANLPGEAQPPPEPPPEFPPFATTHELPALAGDALADDPMAGAMPGFTPKRILPEDLRVSWSWPHLIVFIFFGFASLIVVQLSFVFYVSANRHLSAKQVEQVFASSPQLLVGSNLVWYALLFLFLYVTLAVLRDAPFWRSLGWRKLNPDPAKGKGSPWMYFFSGCGLAIFVALASFNMKNTEHLPIQEIFKNRAGALMLMSMAVLVAPLVEETVFRGYLYPLFAKSLGVAPGIVITGVLFGLMHGSQLGWTWGLVLLLTFVGIVFTFARARTGTVLASFLLHLGYNSMIAVSSIIATKGFQHMPLQP
jgi:membrane protease YdiL (CAAX protease family)